jgi:cyanophycinase
MEGTVEAVPFMLLACTLFAIARPGALYLQGGGATSTELAKRFIADCKSGTIVVLGQTHKDPKDAKASVDFLKAQGATSVRLEDGDEFIPESLGELGEHLDEAAGIWIPGGDQNLFIKRFGKEWLRETFGALLKRGVNFFGTSAGAMIMSNPMICRNGKKPGTAEIGDGIGLTKILIDTHYKARNRQERLRDALRQTKGTQAIGLDEKEWIILRDGTIEASSGTPDKIGFPPGL